jgi:membrane-bound metal-dependent hydrolase YbcI (DUF457 family)
MPDAGKHLGIACIAGVLAYIGYKRCRKEEITLEGLLKSVLTAGFFGMLPDLAEPATDPNHRGLIHSLVAFIGGTYGTCKGLQDNRVNSPAKELLLAAFAGYTSHLLVDGTTPRRLPLV